MENVSKAIRERLDASGNLIKRIFYQIYTETSPIRFSSRNKTEKTFRAEIINILVKNGYEILEYEPKRKNGMYNQEDRILCARNIELKYGYSCNHFYFQISVGDKERLEPLQILILEKLESWLK